MGATPVTYRGNNAKIVIASAGYGSTQTHSTLAISDVSLTISRGTAEQELVGETGNFFLAGSRSIEGSLTACKLTDTGLGSILVSGLIGASNVQISGSVGDNSLHFYFKSCQITGFDFSIGTADEITEGSIDFTLLYPYKVSSVTVDSTTQGTYITDYP